MPEPALIFEPVTQAAMRLDCSRSHYYWLAIRGLVPPPIRFGHRTSRTLLHETYCMVALRVAGASNDAIRERVRELVSMRQELLSEAARPRAATG